MCIILNRRIRYYTKELGKAFKILLFSCLLVLVMLLIKYKPVFQVELTGEQIGYVTNKDTIEETIQEYLNNKEGNVAFVTADNLPTYQFKFIKKEIETNEEQVLLAVKDQTVITYRSYAIKLDGKLQEQVKTMEEAEEVVNQIKEAYQQDLELDLTIEELYTQSNPNDDFVEAEVATANLDGIMDTRVQEKKEAEKAAKVEAEIDGIELTKPLAGGTISSRFGSRSSIRSGAHTGLDIATAYGTPIHPISEGTVTFAGDKGPYGKLVIISHGNGIESYYGHCSKLYVKVGEKVNIDTVRAAVGSTGNSTGNHLHLEIRKDGVPLNPQKYLYK